MDNNSEEPTEESKILVEEMDPRIVEAFYRCLYESVMDEELPMEPSDFQKDHLNLFATQEYKLDLRLSSFKRVSVHGIRECRLGNCWKLWLRKGSLSMNSQRD